MSHPCDALVVSCIDFRFQKFIRDWTDKNLNNQTFDLIGFAGSTKDLDTIMKQLDISVRLHSIKKVILIHHEDCGAYGAESTPENHTRDLQKSRGVIFAKYPNLKIETYYLTLSGEFVPIT
jgi:carbonic anhydrase